MDSSKEALRRTCAARLSSVSVSDLVGGLRRTAPFDISVAAYPEGHPESGGVDAELANLQRKIDAGATRAITQFCFDTDVFLRYRDCCARAGLRAAIVPGIMPIYSFARMVCFALRCGASVPKWLHRYFDGLDQDPHTRQMIAAHVAIDQVQRLLRHGVDEIHFYTLNRVELTYAVCCALGLRADQNGSSIDFANGVNNFGPEALMYQQSSSRTPNSPGI